MFAIVEAARRPTSVGPSPSEEEISASIWAMATLFALDACSAISTLNAVSTVLGSTSPRSDCNAPTNDDEVDGQAEMLAGALNMAFLPIARRDDSILMFRAIQAGLFCRRHSYRMECSVVPPLDSIQEIFDAGGE